MRKSRNKMQPEISPGTPEETGLVQKRVIITNGAVLSYQVLHEDQRGNGDWEFRRLERVTLLARGPSTLMASTFRERTSVCRNGSIDKDSDRSNAQYVCPPLCPEIGTSRSG